MAAAKSAAQRYSNQMNKNPRYRATMREKNNGWNVDVIYKNSGRPYRTKHFRAQNFAAAADWMNTA